MLILALVYFLQIYYPCQIGCLRCISNQCQICDILNNYYLQDNNCVQIKIDKCQQYSHQGVCLYCQSSYYYDKTSNQCVEATTIMNCLYYSGEEECLYCYPEFYLRDNICIPAKIVINHCLIYESENTCLECEKDHLLNFNRKICLWAPKNSFCVFFNEIQCLECKNDYIQNKNFYLQNLFNIQDKFQQDFLDFLETTNTYSKFMKHMPTCIKLQVENCQVFQDYKTCLQCKDGYFLNEDYKCSIYPYEIIDNCKIYLDQKICSECQSNYYLYENTCFEIERINNCKEYDNSHYESKCILCNTSFYLKNNSCIERDISSVIKNPNCKTRKIDEDLCEQCVANMIINALGSQCLIKIKNCISYSYINIESSAECLQCDDGYYLVQGYCEIGNLQNCLSYLSSTECIKCQDGYYLKDSQCYQSNKIDHCISYHGQQEYSPNFCKTCNFGYYPFKIGSFCVEIDLIEYCEVYKDTELNSTCITCSSGYYLQQNKCIQYQDTNCTRPVNSTTCDQCNINYVIYNNNGFDVCVVPFTNRIYKCHYHDAEVENSIALNDLFCNYCEEGYIINPFQYGYSCISSIQLKYLGITNQVNNCLKYSGKNCVVCKLPYVLQIINGVQKCTDFCLSNNHLALSVITFYDQKFEIISANSCQTNYSNNCQIQAPITFGIYDMNTAINENSYQNLHICIKCQNNYYSVVDTNEKKFSNLNPQSISNWTDIQNDLLKYIPEIFCIQPSTFIGNIGNSGVANCSYYQFMGNSQIISCLKCKQGYHGIVLFDESSKKSYIQSCILQEQCNVNIEYFGVHPYYSYYLSCFKCYQQYNIPFIALDVKLQDNIMKVIGLSPYSLNSKNFTNYDSQNQQKNVICQSVDYFKTFFNNFPYNCGLGIINTNSNNFSSEDSIKEVEQIDETKLGLFCGACLPGYKPIYINKLNNHIVVKCEQISDCDFGISQIYFNNCSKCQSGFIYNFTNKNGFDNIDYQNCIPYSLENCFSAQLVDSKYICKVCRIGYILNEDNICDEIKAPYCQSYSQTAFYQRIDPGNVLDYYLYYQPQGPGCNRCDDGYISVYNKIPTNQCMESKYLLTFNDNDLIDYNNSQFIHNCLYYKRTDNIISCAECQPGYSITFDNKKCVQGLLFCEIAFEKNDGSLKCLKCYKNYALINNYCQEGVIENCDQYYSDENQSELLCKKCHDEFYLTRSKQQCILGKVKNCKTYIFDNDKQCQECKEKYFLVKKDFDLCLEINENFNCSKMELDLDNDKLICTKCDSTDQAIVDQTYIEENSLNKNICLQIPIVENCLLYDSNNSISEATLLCIQCTVNYYLKEQQCILRTNIQYSCSNYFINQDLCQKCVDGKFINENNECISFPSGIHGCSKYSDAETCIQCQKSFYLQGNNCQIMDSDDQKLMKNCIVVNYEQNSLKCKQCDQNYFLKDNECLQLEAQNCLTAKDTIACSSCTDNYGLVTTDGVTNCEQIQISNCKIYNYTYPFSCQLCESKYYWNETECLQIPNEKLISGCLYYSSLTQCYQCESQFLLSYHQTECWDVSQYQNSIDPNCNDSRIYRRPICSGCEPGFYFEEEECKQCPIKDGCLQCDPFNDFNCIICKPGYYQSSGECILIESTVVEIKNEVLIKILFFLFLAL